MGIRSWEIQGKSFLFLGPQSSHLGNGIISKAQFLKQNVWEILTEWVWGEGNRNLFVGLCLFNFFKKDFIYLFLERGEGRERNIGQLSLARPQWGTWPQAQACVLTGNQTCNLSVSVCRLRPNPLSHTSRANSQKFLTYIKQNLQRGEGHTDLEVMQQRKMH